MKEPERLIDGAGSDLERQLLQAGLDEQPSRRGMRRAAVAVAAATSVSGLTKWAWAAREFVQPVVAHAGKVVAGSMIVGSTAFLVVPELTSEPEEKAPSFVPVTQPAAVDEQEKPLPAPVPAERPPIPSEPEAAPEAPPAQMPAPSSPAPEKKPVTTTISDEIQALDAARKVLDAGEASRALILLDQYHRKFEKRRLGQEATVMRIRALVQSGKKERAEALARRFYQTNPGSPYNKRIESIVGLKTPR